ncbi:MAG: hypothetical protein M1436_10595 [Acidobacteria bacterium]|nr:hypothetical protein [Acidobacteriota bacterium]
MTSRLAEFVEAHGRAMVLVVLSFALAGFIFIFKLPGDRDVGLSRHSACYAVLQR